VQHPRQRELLRYYRGQGHFVVAGGSFASLCPEEYALDADSVVAGEAEYIWKKFCADFEAGAPLPLYQETGTVSLKDSPTPRFDLLKLEQYKSVSLQFSRGCPFQCEFCDIIVMFGRNPRFKSLEQVGAELDALRERGIRSVFFVDDNLIGNRVAAKELLLFLARYQKEHQYRFRLGTEASLNLAQDDELLRLFQEAGFEWVFMGIESPDKESLKETKKFQNTREDLIVSIRKIYAHGVDIFAGFIIGFDNDKTSVFDAQYNFISESGVQVAMAGLLVALPRTPLYIRLEKEGRLRTLGHGSDNTKLGTNIVPKGMTYEQMVDGYQDLYRRLLEPAAIAQRIRNKLQYLVKPQYQGGGYGKGQRLGILWNTLRGSVKRAGWTAPWHLLRLLATAKKEQRATVLHDWIVGMAMRDFAWRHIQEQPLSSPGRIQQAVAGLQADFAGELRERAVHFSRKEEGKAQRLAVHITGPMEAERLHEMGGRIRDLLRRHPLTLNLRIDSHGESPEHFDGFFQKLAFYGDRVYVSVRENLRHTVPVDSSVFHLVLS
jgi:radical SAM superfamily enzyme YgiQ (UPF0313 family)